MKQGRQTTVGIGTPQVRWREMHQSGRPSIIMFEIRSLDEHVGIGNWPILGDPEANVLPGIAPAWIDFGQEFLSTAELSQPLRVVLIGS